MAERKNRSVPVAGDGLSADERQATEEIMGKTDKRNKPQAKAWNKAGAQGKRKADERKRPATTRATRAQEARATQTEHEMDDAPWVQPASLPEIPARPGMVQRWVRVAVDGKPDNTNIARKTREGFRPRPADTVPKDLPVPKLAHGQFAGCVGIEGMVLMEMSAKRNEQRNAFFREKNVRQTKAINQELAVASRHGSGAFGPIVKSETSKLVREVPISSEE